MTETVLIPKPRRNPLWFVGLYLLAPIGIAIGIAQQPGTSYALAGAVLAGWTVFFAGLVWYGRRQSSRLEGSTLVVRGVRTRSVDLATTRRLRLAPDSTGNAVLTAKADGESAFLRILTVNPHLTYAQSPQVCQALADALRPNPLPEADRIAALLAAQADYLRQGGVPTDSPLMPFTSDALLRAAGIAGVIGALGALEG